MIRRFTLALLLAGAACLGPARAFAGTEEFSTFDVEQQEENDEALLDRLLTRAPHAWRAEWERAAQAFRTEQGCLTSGQWIVESGLKLRAPLGDQANFRLDIRQSESDEVRYNFTDLGFFFPTRHGTFGGTFRPLFDKSAQDILVSWEAGTDTSAAQVRATFGFEDAFNNLWAFRQTRVGDVSEPYLKHPYEPALLVVLRHERWRAEAEARWLTPSRKQMTGATPDDPTTYLSRWGAFGRALVEVRVLGFDWKFAFEDRQARDANAPEGEPDGEGENFRRKVVIEARARRALNAAFALEALGTYQDRDQHHGPPAGPGGFGAIDRVLGLEAQWQARTNLAFRLGTLHDRISIAQSGLVFQPSYGTRTETRAYIGLAVRFGRVNISGVEGVELDSEPYPVWGLHDKGFLQLQTTF